MEWQRLKPDARDNWLTAGHVEEFSLFVPMCERDTGVAGVRSIFHGHSNGVKTNRDEVVYDFDRKRLASRVQKFVHAFNAELDRYNREVKFGAPPQIDEFVSYERIKWSESLKANLRRGRAAQYDPDHLRIALSRPFTKKFLYFDEMLNERRYQFPFISPNATADSENRLIAVSDIAFRAGTFSALMAAGIVDLHLCASLDAHQCFPYYVYDENGINRHENISDWALGQFHDHYQNREITKWDIFYYVYGILHHRGYRERYAENLKRELPRIPLAPDFTSFVTAGQELAKLHLGYEQLDPWPLEWGEFPDVPLSYRVERMRLSKDKSCLAVNNSLTLAGIPPETFHYRLGNRSALEWIIDQYRVSEDSRSGIRSDPNRKDDEKYIVRLVGQVVRVSLETMRIVNGLPEEFSAEPAKSSGRRNRLR